MQKQEENSRIQKEEPSKKEGDRIGFFSNRTNSMTSVDKSLEPKLEMQLSRTVKTNALKTEPTQKDQFYKLKGNLSSTKEQFAKKESLVRDDYIDSQSTFATFSKQNYGVEHSIEENSNSDSDFADKKPSGKGEFIPSGKSKNY